MALYVQSGLRCIQADLLSVERKCLNVLVLVVVDRSYVVFGIL